MSDAITSGLLVFEADEQQQNEFKIDLRKPPFDWKQALKTRSRFQTLAFTRSKVYGDVEAGGDKVVMELAAALQSYPHHGITKLDFFDCKVPELGMLCSTLMKPLPTTTPSTTASRLSLIFRSAIIDHRVIKTMCSLLEDNSLDELCLEHSTMDESSTRDLEESLGRNRSLRYFNCVSIKDGNLCPHFLELACIRNMLLMNGTSLVKLHLSVPDKANISSIFCATSQGNRMSVLQRLRLCDSRIPLRAMEALMMMCEMINSLQDLHFSGCKLSSAALLLLNKTLTNQKVLDSLALEYCETLLPGTDYENRVKDVSLCVNFGKVQVQKLSLQGTKLKPQSFDQMMVDIRNNPFIKSLNVSECVFDSSENASEKFNEAVLQQSRGPSELVIDGIVDNADTITNALQHNSNIKVLTIQETKFKPGLLPFARDLQYMRHICKLTFRFREQINLPRNFLEALTHSVERNSSIQSLVICQASTTDYFTELFRPNIRCKLAINRIKRTLMTTENVPSGLWAHVLSKTSKERDGMYFVLTEKPDIITVGPARNKRKERDDAEE